jgi:hypothetical protein
MAVKARGNVTFTYNSVALTAYMDQADLDGALDMLDDTNFSSTGISEIAGDTKWTFSAGGQADIAVDNALAPDVVTPGTKRTAAIAYDMGAQTVTYTWTSNCTISGYKLPAGVKDLTKWSATFSMSGAPTRSVA